MSAKKREYVSSFVRYSSRPHRRKRQRAEEARWREKKDQGLGRVRGTELSAWNILLQDVEHSIEFGQEEFIVLEQELVEMPFRHAHW